MYLCVQQPAFVCSYSFSFMNQRLVVDRGNQLKEAPLHDGLERSPVLRFLAKVISVVFHPVFVPVYLVYFSIRTVPYLFAGLPTFRVQQFMIQVILSYTIFPIVTILLFRALGFASSFYLRTQKDRILPYVAYGIYSFWVWYVLRNQPEIPREMVVLSLAIWITSALGLMGNIYMKISMHAISMGVAAAYLLMLMLAQGAGFGLYASIALILTGMVCTARFMVSDHTTTEIYGGLIIGIVALVVANWAA